MNSITENLTVAENLDQIKKLILDASVKSLIEQTAGSQVANQ